MRESNWTREDDLNLIDMQIIEESVFIDESGALTFAPMPMLDTHFLDETFPTDQYELQPQTIYQIQKANDDTTIYFVLPEEIPLINDESIDEESIVLTTALDQCIDNVDNTPIIDDDSITLTVNIEDQIINDIDNQSIHGDTGITIRDEVIDDKSRGSIIDDSNIFSKLIRDDIRDLENIDIIDDSSIFSKLLDDDISDIGNETMIDVASIYTSSIDDQSIGNIDNHSDLDVDMATVYCTTIHDENIRVMENHTYTSGNRIVSTTSMLAALEDGSITNIGNQAIMDESTEYTAQLINDRNHSETLECEINGKNNQSDLNQPKIYTTRRNKSINSSGNRSIINLSNIFTTNNLLTKDERILRVGNQTYTEHSIRDRDISNMVDTYPKRTEGICDIRNRKVSEPPPLALIGSPILYQTRIEDTKLGDNGRRGVSTVNTTKDQFISNGGIVDSSRIHQTIENKRLENVGNRGIIKIIGPNIHNAKDQFISDEGGIRTAIDADRIFQGNFRDKKKVDKRKLINTESTARVEDQIMCDTEQLRLTKMECHGNIDNRDIINIGSSSTYTTTDGRQVVDKKDNIGEQKINEARTYQTALEDTKVNGLKIGVNTIYPIVAQDHISIDGDNSRQTGIDVSRIYHTITEDKKREDVKDDDQLDTTTIFQSVHDNGISDADSPTLIKIDDCTKYTQTIDQLNEANSTIFNAQTYYADKIKCKPTDLSENLNDVDSVQNETTTNPNWVDIGSTPMYEPPTNQDDPPDDSIENDLQAVGDVTKASHPQEDTIDIILSDEQHNDENSSGSQDSINPASPDMQANSFAKQHLYRCDYKECQESFLSLYEKKIHFDSHIFQESTEFRCGICNAVFDRAVDRNKHVEAHAIPPTYKCKGCRRDFTYFTVLMRHLKEKRCSSKNPFICYFCEAKITDYDDLIKHHQLNMKQCLCGAKKCGMQVFQLHTSICARNLPDSPSRFEKKRFKKGKT